jgi:electron transfer flavoprotein beta subunit
MEKCMKIIVCVKMTADTMVPLEISSGRLNDEGVVYDVNPADMQALELALAMKEACKAEVTVISLGAKSTETGLRKCLALGADKAIMICDESINADDPFLKATVLAKAIKSSVFDLIMCGEKSRDIAGGTVGAMIAGILNLPQVTSITNSSVSDDGKAVIVSKKAARGNREKISCRLPAVITVAEDMSAKRRYADWDRYLSSLEQKVTVWNLTDIGLTPQEIESPISNLTLSFPKPRTKELPVPDTSLPTFDRILLLISGGLTKRSGKVITGKPEDIISQILEILDHECAQ